MDPNPSANAASASAELSNDPKVLKAELAHFEAAVVDKDEAIRDLRDAEDFALGVYYHKEIFAAQQEKLQLMVEVDMRKVKLRRMDFQQ